MTVNPAPKVSIVVLTYNGLKEVTRPCLESVLRNTPAGQYELIVVDNASADGTPNYLASLAATHPHIRLQLNSVNKGYAGGNNDGIKLATGDVVILLNNDTLLPPGWLPALLRLFNVDRRIGLVGPVTNSAGNEQRIELDGMNEANYEAVARQYAERQKGVWFTTDRLGFFCVAIQRRVIDRIGHLDEDFGLGMFEDDDFCLRARQAGFVLAVAEDCFVYHKGSVSFGKLASQKYRDLFNHNLGLYAAKHGTTWSMAEIALAYWEKLGKDLDVMCRRPNTPMAEAALERIAVRWENLRHVLVQVHGAGLSASEPSLKAPPILLRSRRQTRWFNFRRQVVRGTWPERVRYLRYVGRQLFARIGRFLPRR